MGVKEIVAFLLIVSLLHHPLHLKRKVDLETKDRIKNFIIRKNKAVTSDEAESIAYNIVRYSTQYNVDAKLITALICRESRFNRYAVSPSNAKGLGQLIDSTIIRVGVTDPFDIEDNIRGTVIYFRILLNQFNNNIDLALAAYLLGPNVIKDYTTVPDIKNTQQFIDDIKKFYNEI